MKEKNGGDGGRWREIRSERFTKMTRKSCSTCIATLI